MISWWMAGASAAVASRTAGPAPGSWATARVTPRNDDGNQGGFGRHAARSWTPSARIASNCASASATSASEMTNGGSRRMNGVGGPVDEHAPAQRGLDERRGVDVEIDAPHEPGAAHLADDGVLAGQLAQAGAELRADLPHVLLQAARCQRVEEDERRAARQQVAAVRACRDRRRRPPRRPARSRATAPTGMPAPSALPTATRSGSRPRRW